MGRPRKTDGLRPTLVKRGDRIYAYETTSRIENGKKVNIKRYLGVFDPETGKILEKDENRCAENKRKVSEEKAFRVIDDLQIGDYGGVYLLDEIQKQIGLGKDMFRSFGSASKPILAASIALTMGRPRVYSVENTMDHTWLRRYYGVLESMDSGSMTDFTESIGHSQANIDTLFSFRLERCDEVLCWDTTTHGTYTSMDGLAQYLSVNKDNEDIEQFKVGLATDKRGIPVMYRIYPGTLSDTQTIKSLFDDLEELGMKDAIATFDRGFLSGRNCKDILDRKRKFVMPGKTDYKVFKTLLTQFRQAERKDMRFNDHIYSVTENELGLSLAVDRSSTDGTAAYDFTLPGDDGHGKDGMLKAYVCFDSESYNDQIQTHKLMVSDLLQKASRIECRDPVKEFGRIAGKAARFFEVSAVGKKADVRVKKNSESFFMNRAGMFILVTTPDVTWPEAMSAYEVRRLTEQAYNHSKEEDRRFRTPNKDRLAGRMLLRFISVMLKCEIAARIREAKMENKLDVATCIDAMNTISARKYGNCARLTEITKLCRTVCSALKVDVPADVREGMEIYRQEDLESLLQPE